MADLFFNLLVWVVLLATAGVLTATAIILWSVIWAIWR